MKTVEQIKAMIKEIENPLSDEDLLDPLEEVELDEGQQSWIQALEWVLDMDS